MKDNVHSIWLTRSPFKCADVKYTKAQNRFQNYVQKYTINIADSFFLINSNALHLHRKSALKSFCNLKPLHGASKYVIGR